ncbi:hypothetical protein [Vibrio cholerae]|uniref:hypothetical protein n=1 Tax=Vibrio cholerae TaxID=666 RepID=UPI001F075C90|nr:hypothetical protein [Vibrio cholerae]
MKGIELLGLYERPSGFATANAIQKYCQNNADEISLSPFGFKENVIKNKHNNIAMDMTLSIIHLPIKLTTYSNIFTAL